ncbi:MULTISPECIES: exosortase/archaeosortase family protein [unclassified Lentimonas]|uniref:exosortase/archaeosortase family protein n=1 Tax=unclassified Lentimonas TaxID=2630993 RepID=UPI001326B60A|nr:MULTISPECIES: exosortase/archaeosortase family protein [unclassified Lentimonas]CAA6677588.1 Unannotated [Lentimonas sp. CC4]CAA6684314.1 Unannotated [Lentimonas sp. CC6]CAA7078167.1 Unannotated [Lentimonas sp. CC4]CAA7168315.1 Unannotated [Lentimonas sp. CC21]CAA7181852.1 Unannotated [Lentimonas sp. CC8]
MPRYLRFILLLIGFIPYAAKVPYMLRAWSDSPQDRFDWIFVSMFALLFPLAWLKTRKRMQVAAVDYAVLIVLLPALLGYGAAVYATINALQILCGIAIAYSVFWLIYGGQNAYRMLPVFALLTLGITSTTYWINYYVGDPGMTSGYLIKFTTAGILLLWLAVNLRWETKVQTRSLLYSGAVCLAILYIWQSEETSSQKGAPVILQLSEGKTGPYLGQTQEVTADDIRFFGEDSVIEKFYYIGDASGIYILALTCGRKINSIHPASHCLRSSGWTILSEEILKTSIDEDALYLTEIVAESQNQTYLFWVLYSNSEFSTGSFVHFRKEWNRDETWHTYQLMIPLESEESQSLIKARKEILALLQDTKKHSSKTEECHQIPLID